MHRPSPLADPHRLIRRVYAYVAYRLGDGPEAEDATSQTFERALRCRRTYDEARGEPVSWLLGIARNVIAERLSAPRLEPVEPPDVEARGVSSRRPSSGSRSPMLSRSSTSASAS
ncbi:MAG: hypothetical protein H0T39_00705 [Actinobacteria bacterium]|nr:hypothetical protein [Actinomycetota bacterium]